jgi:hypothetical protein
MKQYYVKKAYTDNYYVITCEDDKITDARIIEYYKITGYIDYLKSHGYSEAYYVPDFKRKFEEAEEAYKLAKELYEKAIANPLQVSEEETKKYICFDDLH